MALRTGNETLAEKANTNVELDRCTLRNSGTDVLHDEDRCIWPS